jgi:acyl-coenzyme A synthetase/AMP-(fatty) acid ligase
VADVCVVGMDHADMGQIPVAVVQFADNVNDIGEALESLQALALNRLHGPMRPCRWVVVEELPRQATGKINFKQVAALAR